MLIRNTAANAAGQLVYPVLALALVPFYIRHLGLEGYGLIGLMALVVSLLSVFSRGLGGALQREVSQRLASGDGRPLRVLLRSMEVGYGAAGATIALLLIAVSTAAPPALMQTEILTAREVSLCLALLAVRVALAFPHSVYHAVLMGSDRQVVGSSLAAALALTSAAAGVAAVLAFGSVVAVYASEAVTAGLFLLIYRHCGYRALPAAPAAFEPGEIRGLLSVSVALMWTSGVGLLLSTLDRLFVGALLPVTALGVYTIAVMAGRLLTLFYNPYLQAAYPQMCRIARGGSADEQALDILRNHAALLVIAAAIGIPLAAFAGEVLALWVGDGVVIRRGAPVLSIYVAGSLLIGFAAVLYQWQTATGRTAVAVRFNGAALVWFPILLGVLVLRLELIGGAIAWAVYGALAWAVNLRTTFAAGALPARHLRALLRITILALLPAVVFTLLARLIADNWFSGALWSRSTCGVCAGICGAVAAVIAVRGHLGGPIAGRGSSLTSQPAFNTAAPE